MSRQTGPISTQQVLSDIISGHFRGHGVKIFILPKLSVSFTCKLKKINDHKCFLLKVLQMNETLN